MGSSIAFVGIDLIEGGGMYGVELYRRVRLACRHEGLSRREAARRFEIDRKMVAKMLAFSAGIPAKRSATARPGRVSSQDWATRHVLSWRLSNTIDAGFCVEALQEALSRYGRPEIFNTDQGSQLTSCDFTGSLKDANVAISTDGRARCMDNVFIERLLRSLKYEAVYLHDLSDGFKAERVIGERTDFYNTERPHSALAGRTPAEAYGAGRPVDMMDKPDGLPTSPQAQQQQKDTINKDLAA